MKHVAIILLKAYQRFISPLLPNSCRFYPTCSQYAIEAIREHGMIRGAWLGIKRIGRCHPFHPGGHDPVPPAAKSSSKSTATRTNGSAHDSDEESR